MNTNSIIKFISCFNGAQISKLEKLALPTSSLLNNILDLLTISGLIVGCSNNKNITTIYLKQQPYRRLRIVLVSKPSRKVYMSYKDIEKNFSKDDFVLISSTLGFITAKEAVMLRTGGEIVFRIE